MCSRNVRTVAGTAAVAFSAGVIAAYLLPGFVVAFVEAALLVGAGIILLKR